MNAIEYYEAGKLARREYDLGGKHRIDTWDWFDPSSTVDAKTGRPSHPSRRERDTTGDGHIDQWWTWNGDQLTIAMDKNGDGKPEPENTMSFASDGGVSSPPANAGPPGAASAPAAASATPAPSVAAATPAPSAAPDAPAPSAAAASTAADGGSR